MFFQTLNPTTEELLQHFPEHGLSEAQAYVQALHEAVNQRRCLSVTERTAGFQKLAKLLRGQKKDLAALITLEMGKPIVQAEAEVEKCAWICDTFAESGPAFLQPVTVPSAASLSRLHYEPLGVILIIMPWNFPFWQVFRTAIPVLTAGNAVLLKHAPNVPQCALAIEKLFHEAGFQNVFRSLFLSNETVAGLLNSPHLHGVSLTGSARAGRTVAAVAGQNLKKLVLELGGSDPFIVLNDADLKLAVEGAIQARMMNAGQVCISAKRFFLEKGIAAHFETELVQTARSQIVGDPQDRATQMGPLARKDLLENLERQVHESVRQGAQVLCGGERLKRKGYFYPPTVLKNVTPTMPVFCEETFGPVACLMTVKNADEALQLANQTRYGLGASVWTQDLKKAEIFQRGLEVGSVFVNGIVHSDPRLPFGGTKESGFGRELGREGLLEWTNIKTVWIR